MRERELSVYTLKGDSSRFNPIEMSSYAFLSTIYNKFVSSV